MPLWSPADSPAECALQMIERYETLEAAIQRAHAYDIDASADEERAHWRAVLRKLRASPNPLGVMRRITLPSSPCAASRAARPTAAGTARR